MQTLKRKWRQKYRGGKENARVRARVHMCVCVEEDHPLLHLSTSKSPNHSKLSSNQSQTHYICQRGPPPVLLQYCLAWWRISPFTIFQAGNLAFILGISLTHGINSPPRRPGNSTVKTVLHSPHSAYIKHLHLSPCCCCLVSSCISLFPGLGGFTLPTHFSLFFPSLSREIFQK